MLCGDISLLKLKQKGFRAFPEKYTEHSVPDESILRKGYMKECHDDMLAKIRVQVWNDNVSVSMDETTDRSRGYVGNVLIGALRTDKADAPILLNRHILE